MVRPRPPPALAGNFHYRQFRNPPFQKREGGSHDSLPQVRVVRLAEGITHRAVDDWHARRLYLSSDFHHQ